MNPNPLASDISNLDPQTRDPEFLPDSESVSQYSTSSGVYGGDTKNVIKYNQFDLLFYRNFNEVIFAVQ